MAENPDSAFNQMRRFDYLNAEIEAVYHEAALVLGLSYSAMRVLYTVCAAKGECTLKDAVHLTGLCKQTVNSAVRKLEEQGIIITLPADKKSKKLCFTDKGRTLAQNTVQKIIDIENDIFGSWLKEQIEWYLELTEKYLDSFKQKLHRIR